MLQQRNGLVQNVVGISPLENIGDSVSAYEVLDYAADIRANFAHFGLDAPKLVKAYSTDDVAKAEIASHKWDCIYIDGNHDYDIVLEDWNNCADALADGGIIVMDDAGMFTRYKAFGGGFTGHPGPSQVASEVVSGRFRKILQVDHNIVFQKAG